jgi:NADH:ubiquinone oxidoreductase subunit K
MSIELMFNGVNIMAVAFSRWITPYTLSNEPSVISVITEEVVRHLLTGQAFAIFIIAVAAAEVALGLGIVMAIYRVRETVSITEANLLKR